MTEATIQQRPFQYLTSGQVLECTTKLLAAHAEAGGQGLYRYYTEVMRCLLELDEVLLATRTSKRDRDTQSSKT